VVNNVGSTPTSPTNFLERENMPGPYVKFNDINFDTKRRKQFCKLLYKEIREFEESIIMDEEYYHFVKDLNERAAELSLAALELNRRLLLAMKMTFLYYTGVSSSQILDEDKPVDIFNIV